MKAVAAIALLCIAILPLACGDSESSTSARQVETSSPVKSEPRGEPPAAKWEPPRIGSVEQEGPFAAISDGRGNEMPHFDTPDRPAPKRMLVRDIKKGSGPAARVGDTISAYYVGALYKTGDVKFYGWPPSRPMTFELGSGTLPALWKAAFVGLRAGGVREVVAPSSLFNGSGAYDYLMALVSVEPKSQ